MMFFGIKTYELQKKNLINSTGLNNHLQYIVRFLRGSFIDIWKQNLCRQKEQRNSLVWRSETILHFENV